MTLDIPVKTVSAMNRREHWRAAMRRKASERAVVRSALSVVGKPPPLPVRVLLTRHSPGTLDAHDNLRASLKHVVDEIADWLGVDDGRTDLVEWNYDQSKCKRGLTWVTMEVICG